MSNFPDPTLSMAILLLLPGWKTLRQMLSFSVRGPGTAIAIGRACSSQQTIRSIWLTELSSNLQAGNEAAVVVLTGRVPAPSGGTVGAGSGGERASGVVELRGLEHGRLGNCDALRDPAGLVLAVLEVPAAPAVHHPLGGLVFCKDQDHNHGTNEILPFYPPLHYSIHTCICAHHQQAIASRRSPLPPPGTS